MPFVQSSPLPCFFRSSYLLNTIPVAAVAAMRAEARRVDLREGPRAVRLPAARLLEDRPADRIPGDRQAATPVARRQVRTPAGRRLLPVPRAAVIIPPPDRRAAVAARIRHRVAEAAFTRPVVEPRTRLRALAAIFIRLLPARPAAATTL